MNLGLKEWSAAIRAIAEGHQLFLLRKGGIVEGRRGFHLMSPEFLLIPSFEHQHAASLKPEFRNLAEPQPADTIRLDYVAHVTEHFPAPPDRASWNALDRLHIWQPSLLDMRYSYRPDLPMYVLFIRLLRLPKQISVPNRPSYAGCKSWVHLTEEIETADATPLIDNATYLRHSHEVRSAFASVSPESTSIKPH